MDIPTICSLSLQGRGCTSQIAQVFIAELLGKFEEIFIFHQSHVEQDFSLIFGKPVENFFHSTT
ncbi:hypothetical protein ThidrDRAFT_4313 [Thiorhodococcus drewsii AZ1]|uniref:Uncharacterized protein n=1 Tax=Thiorhodococcus drewsii AZ1 TaxID=765913 RepID=G2E7Q0_9GAMM|nr:hypothetical protein ThidrDRAFT_4313 [Thiorhodococcus drewsii AZ1]